MTTTHTTGRHPSPEPTWSIEPGCIAIDEGDCQLRLQPAGDRVIRVSVRSDPDAAWRAGDFVTPARDVPQFRTARDKGVLTVEIPGLTVAYDSGTRDITFARDGVHLLRVPGTSPRLTPRAIERPVRNGESDVVSQSTTDGVKASVGTAERTLDRVAHSARIELEWADGEAVYGLGQHEEGHLNLRDTRQDLYQHNTKISIPFLLSSRGYGILVDCASLMEFDDVGETSALWCSAVDQLDWYLIDGGCLDGVVATYRDLTGAAPLPPKAMFGYVQSRERYQDQSQLLAVAQEFQDRQIPLGVIVLDWMTWPEGQWGEKSFDTTRFPDPHAMVEQLHRQGVRLMMSIWPNLSGEGSDHREMREAGHLLGNDSVYDAFSPQAREL